MSLVWSSPARRDLFRIAFDELNLVPDQLLERIETAPLALLDFPDMGSPTRFHGIRKWRVAKTPFLLFYAVEKDRIAIRRVIHASSDWANQF